MASFEVGQTITTREPGIVVDAGLKPGRHLFQLVVATADGRISKPDQGVVTVTLIRPPIGPGPVIPGPINPGPIDPGPVIPRPLGPGPIDPGPVIHGPVIPGPVTPGPINPGPVTPRVIGRPVIRGVDDEHDDQPPA